MSEVEASSMAESVSTQKKKKKKTLNQLNLGEPKPSTVFKSVRLNRGLHGSLNFSYIPVFEVKRTVLVNGFRLTSSDRTVQFHNLFFFWGLKKVEFHNLGKPSFDS